MPYKLDRTAEAVGIFRVVKRNVGYTLGLYLFRINMFAEGESRQNADLAAGVMPFNIRCRIFLGKALFLRERKSGIKIHILYYHFI